MHQERGIAILATSMRAAGGKSALRERSEQSLLVLFAFCSSWFYPFLTPLSPLFRLSTQRINVNKMWGSGPLGHALKIFRCLPCVSRSGLGGPAGIIFKTRQKSCRSIRFFPTCMDGIAIANSGDFLDFYCQQVFRFGNGAFWIDRSSAWLPFARKTDATIAVFLGSLQYR